MHNPGRYPLLALLTWILTSASSATAQDSFSIRHVTFMAGCWAGRTGDLEVREQWTDPVGGVMLGTTRFLRDGIVVDWEFGRIVEVDGIVTFWPYPRGERSADGFPLVRAGEEAVFENLDHDFPVRIVYARIGTDGLHPRTEGRDGEGPSWPLRRSVCPGA